jgi:hypothetical protein
MARLYRFPVGQKGLFEYDIDLSPLAYIPQELYKQYVLQVFTSSKEASWELLDRYRIMANVSTAIAIPSFVHAIVDLQVRKIYTHGFGTWWRINPRTTKLKQRIKHHFHLSKSYLKFVLHDFKPSDLGLSQMELTEIHPKLWGNFIGNLSAINLSEKYSRILTHPERYLFVRSGTLLSALYVSLKLKNSRELHKTMRTMLSQLRLSGSATFLIRNLKPPYPFKPTKPVPSYYDILLFHRIGAKTRLKILPGEKIREKISQETIKAAKKLGRAKTKELLEGKMFSEKQLSEINRISRQLFVLRHLDISRKLKGTTKKALVQAYQRKYGIPESLTVSEFLTIPDLLFRKGKAKYVVRQVVRRRTLISKKKYKSTFRQRYFIHLLARLPQREYFLTRQEILAMYRATRAETYDSLFKSMRKLVDKMIKEEQTQRLYEIYGRSYKGVIQKPPEIPREIREIEIREYLKLFKRKVWSKFKETEFMKKMAQDLATYKMTEAEIAKIKRKILTEFVRWGREKLDRDFGRGYDIIFNEAIARLIDSFIKGTRRV